MTTRIWSRRTIIGARVFKFGWERDGGTEIIEFAVSLPLLVILAVAIFDFGSAFTLKHKLNGAVREAARVALSQTHTDLTTVGVCSAPASICRVRDVVVSELQTSIGNTCGLDSASGSPTGPLTWTFTGDCSLEINRGIPNPNTVALADPFDATPYTIENTKITLIYPYQWQFNRAFKLLDSNANYLRSTITVSSTVQNLD